MAVIQRIIPVSIISGKTANLRQALQPAAEPFNTFDALPPAFMLHLAGVRTGAWARRALLRSHGWWHAQADALAAAALGWGARRGVLAVAANLDVSAAASAAQLDVLVGNLLLLAALLGRVPIAPEIDCAATKGPREPLVQVSSR